MSDELPAHAIARLRDALAAPDVEGFRLVQRLGRGGMGAVWLAHDERLEREVALKVLAHPLSDDAAQQRLLHEARILARLEHPGIVPVHDAGVLPDGRAWYAMKRVRGRRLDEHVVATTPMAERLRIFERLCETLAFAHARGVLHRDLKPGNVMIGEFGEVLVLDWGVAKIVGVRDGAGVVGTPGFMAPEQAEGRSDEADARTDVFGLGALLRAMLGDESPRELHGIVPRELRAIARKAVARRPEDRYASVDELRADVTAFREGRSVSALPEGWMRRALRVLSRHRVAVGLVLAYLLMRAVVAVVFRR